MVKRLNDTQAIAAQPMRDGFMGEHNIGARKIDNGYIVHSSKNGEYSEVYCEKPPKILGGELVQAKPTMSGSLAEAVKSIK